MRQDHAATVLDELSTEFEQLRSNLLRSAKALAVAEDQRADVLTRLARRSDPDTARELHADAHQARSNADSAVGIAVQLERMSMAALARTREPRLRSVPVA